MIIGKGLFKAMKIQLYIKKSIKRMINLLFSFTKVKHDRVIFECYHGSKYADSIKTMYEYIRDNTNFECIWVLNNVNQALLEEGVKIVKRNSFKYYFYYSTSKYWITNSHRYNDIAPKPETIYTMIWHGMGDFKKFAGDIKGQPASRFKSLRKDAEEITYFVCSSENIKDTYSRALLLDKNKIHALGLPRNDMFYDEDVKNRIRDKYKKMFATNKKIILYAPTYRDAQKDFEVIMNFKKMYEELHEEYVVLVKAHYFVKNELNIPDDLKDFIIDVCYYDDIQELLIASDILVTDYSSVFFDFIIMNKPTIFYAYDKEEYIKNWGGFYHDYDSFVPGPIVKDCEELIETLKNKDKLKLAIEQASRFILEYDDFKDGKATERVYNLIFNGDKK